MVESVDKEVMTKQERRVRATRSEGCRVEIKARKHAFVADEPAQGGGTDTGPTPRELSLGALSACITARIQLSGTPKRCDASVMIASSDCG